MEFNGKLYRGTGCIIHSINTIGYIQTHTSRIHSTHKTGYILTAAHNVVEIDPISNKHIFATHIWFSLKKGKYNEKHTEWCKFSITKSHVYPKYWQSPDSLNGYDAAICEFEYREKIEVPCIKFIEFYINEKLDENEKQLQYYNSFVDNHLWNIEINGFPGEKKEELWGMSIADKNTIKNTVSVLKKKQPIITYSSIDTSPGQSGSMLVFSSQISAGNHCIAGIHVGGSAIAKKNWSTRITKDLMNWMAKITKTEVEETDWCPSYGQPKVIVYWLTPIYENLSFLVVD